MSGNCIFCKIARAEIPCKKVYEDDDVIAFHDINPVAPVHFMLVPKLHIASLLDVEEIHTTLLGKMLLLAPKLAREQGLENGFRTVINSGKGTISVLDSAREWTLVNELRTGDPEAYYLSAPGGKNFKGTLLVTGGRSAARKVYAVNVAADSV